MKKALLSFAIIATLLACQKEATPVQAPLTPVADSTSTDSTIASAPIDTVVCTPFAQRLLMKLDRTRADSAWLQLPCAYATNAGSEKYPLLIFLNGIFEGSDYGNLEKMIKLGPPKYMMDSLRYSFTVNGKQENLIVVCPQSRNGFRAASSTNQVINYMIAHYNVDTNRIYLTGLSAGAHSILRYMTEKQEYANRIAAAVPMSTVGLDSTHRAQLGYISNANVPLYWFCGSQDEKYLKTNQTYAEKLNQLSPGLVQFKLYNGAHKSWNPMYSVSHTYYNPTIYEWMLQFSK